MLRRIEAERDEAIHDYAARFDRWSSAEYRVSPDRIRALAANLSETFEEDFEFRLKSVQEFARHQRDTPASGCRSAWSSLSSSSSRS